MTEMVSNLGLDLGGVPQSKVDAAQVLLDSGTATHREVRDLLRPLCGPEQEAAEEIALAFLDRHVLQDGPDPAAAWYRAWNTEWCTECARPFPCPAAAADLLVIGVFQ
jgi:hypothetical protein